MSNEEWLRKRWEGREKIVSRILELLRKRDDSWPSLIKEIQFTDEVPNGRDLRGVFFKGQDLRLVAFKDADLRYSDLCGSDLRGADFETADLRGAQLDDILVDEETDWGTHFAYFKKKRKQTMPRLKYIITYYLTRFFGYKGKIYSERKAKTKGDFLEAQKVYDGLRRAYKNRNVDPTAADYFYYRENHCGLIVQYDWWHPATWIGYLWEKFSCTGTAPLRVFLILAIFIAICASIYLYVPDGIVRESADVSAGVLGIRSYGEALYFSIITFTSVGYGDFHPNMDSENGQIMKYICSMEALVGIISIALLAAIFLNFMSKD